MKTLKVACPSCRKGFRIEIEDGQRVTGRAQVACDHCGVSHRLKAYMAEVERQQRLRDDEVTSKAAAEKLAMMALTPPTSVARPVPPPTSSPEPQQVVVSAMKPAKYRVTGTSGSTGEHVDIWVEATTEDGAREAAERAGIVPAVIYAPSIPAAPLTAPAPPSPTPAPGPQHVQTIERTGKSWKAMQLAGGLGLICGIIMFIVGEVSGGRGAMAALSLLGFFLGVVSFLFLVFARIGAWWYHG